MTDEHPKPKPPMTREGRLLHLPAPPDDEHDTAEGWATYAADLFRARGDWRMVRAASSIATAIAAADDLELAQLAARSDGLIR